MLVKSNESIEEFSKRMGKEADQESVNRFWVNVKCFVEGQVHFLIILVGTFCKLVSILLRIPLKQIETN